MVRWLIYADEMKRILEGDVVTYSKILSWNVSRASLEIVIVHFGVSVYYFHLIFALNLN
jgi:hypothetical protein